jgi:hypothetical protein
MTKIQKVFTKLLLAVDSKTEYTDGSIWGMVYLPNVGDTHELLACLSLLQKSGDYRPVGECFGEVRMRIGR